MKATPETRARWINRLRSQRRDCRHADPNTWVDAGEDRRGYVETRCKLCGGFIGFRPPADRAPQLCEGQQ
ncbi:MAG TPA: hypothetical protein VGJ26_03855 [Pirellulales bacterium]